MVRKANVCIVCFLHVNIIDLYLILEDDDALRLSGFIFSSGD